jgi:hypothetical protein
MSSSSNQRGRGGRGGRGRGGRGERGGRGVEGAEGGPGSRFNWHDGDVFVDLLQALADHITAGRRADSSFKKQAFVSTYNINQQRVRYPFTLCWLIQHIY